MESTQILKLELSVEQINFILQGLGELPAKVSISVIESIRTQAQSQLSQQTQPVEE